MVSLKQKKFINCTSTQGKQFEKVINKESKYKSNDDFIIKNYQLTDDELINGFEIFRTCIDEKNKK